MNALANRIWGVLWGGIVFWVFLASWNQPLAGGIAGFVVYCVYVAWKDASYAEQTRRAREAEIEWEESIRARSRPVMEPEALPVWARPKAGQQPIVAPQRGRVRRRLLLILGPVMILAGIAAITMLLSVLAGGNVG